MACPRQSPVDRVTRIDLARPARYSLPKSRAESGPRSSRIDMSADVKSNAHSVDLVRAARTEPAVRHSSCGLRSPTATRPWVTFGLFVVAGLLALVIDVPLSRAIVQDHALQWLHRFLEMIEPFGQPPAVIAVSLAVLLCGDARRGSGFRIAAGALLSGLA